MMPSNMTNAKASEFIQQLKSNGWIDGASRAVIIEFAAYNKQTMIFVQTKLFVEFFTTGGAFTYPQFAVCKLATVGTETHLYHQRVALGFRIAVFVFVIRFDCPRISGAGTGRYKWILHVAMELPRLTELRCICCMLSLLFRLFSHENLTQTTITTTRFK